MTRNWRTYKNTIVRVDLQLGLTGLGVGCHDRIGRVGGSEVSNGVWIGAGVSQVAERKVTVATANGLRVRPLSQIAKSAKSFEALARADRINQGIAT